MGRVFIVQDPQRKDRRTGKLESTFDFTPAQEYGEPRFLLGSGASPFNPNPIIDQLAEGLADFDPEQDWLLLAGNPVLIGIASALAAEPTGTVRFLQWSGTERKYKPVVAAIFTDE